MKPFKRIALVAALLPLMAPTAWGLGLGEITMRSYLNEPLKAEVNLLDVKNLTGEDIRIRLGTQEDFDRLGVDRAYFLTSIKFEVVVDGDESKIVLTTDKPLLEPYLDFLIETRWPAGRLLREYTVLVDLPRQAETARVAGYSDGQEQAGSDTASGAVAEQSASQPTEKTFVTPDSRPDRDYDRDATQRPKTGGRYLVQTADTLWEIASAARPDGATIEQTMIATVAMNSDAFTGGNINGLKAGYVLELPAEGEIYTSRSEAIAEVGQQNSDWANGIRRAPALRVVADNEMDDGVDEDVAEDIYDGSYDSDVGADDEMLASAGADLSDGTSGTQSDVAVGSGSAADDSAPVATNTELADIQARLGQLSEQVGSLRQLVSVKDQQIAALQAELEARDQADANKAAAVPVPAQPAPANPGFGGLPWWVYALGGVILVGLGGAVIARRGNRGFVPAPRETSVAQGTPAVKSDEPAKPKAARSAAAVAAAPAEAEETRTGERGYGQKLHNDYAEENAVSDAIAEADIYIAYGRHQQALDLLSTASAADPNNAAAYVKMVQIYIANDRREEAEALIPAIEKTQDAEALERATGLISARLGDPKEIELGDLADKAESETSSPTSELAAMEFELETPLSAVPDNGQASESGDEASADDDGLPSGLDLELDFDTSTPEEPAEPPTPAPDWGDLSESVADDADRLPPELAEVLGSDIRPPPAGPTVGDDDNELVYASEADPMETKLDLARAYLDMGDEEGARPVLEEIVAEGDLQQQAEARELLIRID